MSVTKFLTEIQARRSIYALAKLKGTTSNARIQEIVHESLKHAPSSFNSRSQRAIILFNEHHDKLWDTTLSILKTIITEEQVAATTARINGFKAAHGTVLFFEDNKDVEALQEQFPAYAGKFPQYSQHASGIFQYIVWTALAQENIGASLQHYSPLIDTKVREFFDVPASWQLIAQMPFGEIVAPAGDKDFGDVAARIKTFA
ncbi:Nitroreductase-like protein [Gaertneriomyces semiglobifer]|nr:Nitroreductase-like protein [Gaertneriomyces semiglobifer]